MPRDWSGVGLAWLRILIGCGIAQHGFGKIFGGNMQGFTQMVAQMGLPAPVLLAWAAALSEFVGGICVVAGFGTRIAALFIFCTMSVALFIKHGADPFSVKELAYLYWAVAGSLILFGGGPYGLERYFVRRR